MRPEMRRLVLRLRAAALFVRGRRAPKTAVLAVLALGAGPVTSALATPVGTVTQDTTAHTITCPGRAAVNDVQLTYRNGNYVIEDNGAAAAANGVSAGLGCYPEDNVSTTAMTCDEVSNGKSPSRVIINLGDGDDRFYSILGLPDLNTFEVGAEKPVTVVAGPGDDAFGALKGGTNDAYDGGTGMDIVSYEDLQLGGNWSRTAAVTVDLSVASPTGGQQGETDTIANTESVIGTHANDHLTSGAGPSILWGLGGDDTLNGGAGDDTIYPGDGSDTVDAAGGRDMVSYLERSAGMTVNLATGTAGQTSGGETDSIANFEDAPAPLFISGSSDPGTTLTGTDGANKLIGGSYVDHLVGAGGDDILQPGGSPGGTGGPAGGTVDGGTGNDTLDYSERTVPVTIDFMTHTATDTVKPYSDTFQEAEKAIGGSAGDTFRTRDGVVQDIDCGGGADSLFGDVSGQFSSVISDVLTACESVNADYVPPAEQSGSPPADTTGSGSLSPAPTSSPSGTTPPPAPAKPTVRCLVPKLKGLTLRRLKKALTKAHCRLGKIKKVKAKKSDRGRVLAHTPKAGTKKRAGTRIVVMMG